MADDKTHDSHEHADGCLCGANHDQHEATPDQELPPATGGVATKAKKPRATRTSVSKDD